MVKAAPNRSVVEAKINDVKKTEDPDVLLANIEVLSSEGLPGYLDFTKDYVGKTINTKLYAKDKNVRSKKKTRLMMKYEGDEHGGSFYAQEQDS